MSFGGSTPGSYDAPLSMLSSSPRTFSEFVKKSHSNLRSLHQLAPLAESTTSVSQVSAFSGIKSLTPSSSLVIPRSASFLQKPYAISAGSLAAFNFDKNIVNLPGHILSDICFYLYNDTQDAINFGRTCKTLNDVANKQLYMNIMIVNDNASQKIYNKKYTKQYTVLFKSKLPDLVRTLKLNPRLPQFYVEEIVISTTSDANGTGGNTFEPLYKVLMKSQSLVKCDNLDYNNSKIYYNFIDYNKTNYIQGNFRNIHHEEVDEMEYDEVRLRRSRSMRRRSGTMLSSSPYLSRSSGGGISSTSLFLFDKSIMPLREFQLLNWNDINILNPATTKSLKIYVPRQNIFSTLGVENFKVSRNGIQVLERLNELHLNATTTTYQFLNHVSELVARGAMDRMQLLTLSVTNTHRYKIIDRDNVQDTKLLFHKLNSAIDMTSPWLKNLELKMNCDDMNCQLCFSDAFFKQWLEAVTPLVTLSESLSGKRRKFQPSIANVEKLVIVNNKNNSSHQWCDFITDYLPFFLNLRSFYVNLNDFTKLPNSSNPHMLHSDQVVAPDADLHDRTVRMFNAILRLKSLQELIIPDFFYNWVPYMTAPEGERDPQALLKSENFVARLNKCRCDSCDAGRATFAELAKFDYFKDFKNLNMQMEDEDSLPGSLKLSYEHYCYANYILTSLKSRIPLKNIFTITTLLDYMKVQPLNDFEKKHRQILRFESTTINADASAITGESQEAKVNKVISLLIHAIRPEISQLVKSQSRLETIVAGGIHTTFDRASGSIGVSGVYDVFSDSIVI
ncbi:hypothetical protein BABINDRAFT_168210 [Babjeviella inositovora NRRL Y-12698]|uniref:F-box domain-containing protein n=1 Tax=Babjeviella inositovora NRRL Y-12698 TaxID=984486 RepID=A0A1E3QL91_9ASCO|nr:uncharacterized protein BABINDRAFT_168210 [Babjeviella inositovora NRRL Y-12698]ODQ78469.1 hypothetical protein BABINDRAFT_168210 [Babjeviella inositovora NRRL Y-12698]